MNYYKRKQVERDMSFNQRIDKDYAGNPELAETIKAHYYDLLLQDNPGLKSQVLASLRDRLDKESGAEKVVAPEVPDGTPEVGDLVWLERLHDHVPIQEILDSGRWMFRYDDALYLAHRPLAYYQKKGLIYKLANQKKEVAHVNHH